MSKTGWQYTAIFLGALLFLTNAAQFYSRRVLQVELAAYIEASAQPSAPQQAGMEPSDSNSIVDYGSVTVTGLAPGQRCINGQRFGQVNGFWEQLPGSC